MAGQADLFVELGGGLRGVERHLKFGPLVFLDPESGHALRPPLDLEIIWPMSRSRGAVKLPAKEP